ncbi:hypothetical protein N0V84_001428 [Fusarium piperis]|uniref:Uncharacterized protein n=1 Tax=Fusarium piperis TaxID=1435070 RepID=A0A9W8WL65_9HYPO|nr:hypothetical protein N0V84_001428 [Fusarium piperis]
MEAGAFAHAAIEPIESRDRVDEVDEFATSDYDAESVSFQAASLNSSINQHFYENGRRVSDPK